MRDAYSFTAENLLCCLPAVLRENPSVLAICTAAAKILENGMRTMQVASIYPNIMRMPEGLLDILAYDFKVDWYDTSFSLQEKRETIASNWRVRRFIGTKYAVESALSAIYPDTKVQEWFQYGGEPYHFKILINVASDTIDVEKHEKVLAKIRYYKNLRSVLDCVEYYDATGEAVAYAAVGYAGETITERATAVQYG